MERKVYRTKLRPERRHEYIEAHRTFSRELLRRYSAAGITACEVYVLDDDIVLIVESEDHSNTCAILANDTLDREWQTYLQPMKADGDWQEMEELFVADLAQFQDAP